MRHGWMATLGLCGCLYVGGINHAPEGEITVEAQDVKTEEWVVVTADVTDRDDDELRYEWSLEINPVDGETMNASLGSMADGGSGAAGPAAFFQPDSESLTRVKVWTEHRGTYTVRLRALDERGAHGELETTFQVGNQPPEIKLKLDVEERFKLTDRYPDTGFAGGEERNPAHAHYLVALDEAASSDHEGDLACEGKATIKYELVQPGMATTDYWDTVSCQEGQLLDRLRFRLDPAKVTQAQTVKIKVTVDDGHGGVVEQVVGLDVVPNRPACITKGDQNEGTSPPMPPEGGGGLKVPVSALEGLAFEVRFVSDDVDEGFTYTWQVRNKGASAFEPLQQGSGARLTLAPWFRMPGQEVELRVVVGDRQQSSLPSCAVDTALCREPSASLPVGCYQWVTWQLDFY